MVEEGLVDPQIPQQFKKTSSFLGKTADMLRCGNIVKYTDRCKMCFKNFSIFAQKRTCVYCGEDNVCGGCCRTRLVVQSQEVQTFGRARNKLRVCDGCVEMLKTLHESKGLLTQFKCQSSVNLSKTTESSFDTVNRD